MAYLKAVDNDSIDDSGIFRPQLTSLVDVMTILLVFLIKSFSVEGNLITPAKDLQLPVSISKEHLKQEFTFAVTSTQIIRNGEKIVDISDFENSESLLIPPFLKWLEKERAKIKSKKEIKKVLIQVDKRLEFNIIKRVVFTCSRAGFTNFSVMVETDE